MTMGFYEAMESRATMGPRLTFMQQWQSSKTICVQLLLEPLLTQNFIIEFLCRFFKDSFLAQKAKLNNKTLIINAQKSLLVMSLGSP